MEEEEEQEGDDVEGGEGDEDPMDAEIEGDILRSEGIASPSGGGGGGGGGGEEGGSIVLRSGSSSLPLAMSMSLRSSGSMLYSGGSVLYNGGGSALGHNGLLREAKESVIREGFADPQVWGRCEVPSCAPLPR